MTLREYGAQLAAGEPPLTPRQVAAAARVLAGAPSPEREPTAAATN